MEREQQITKLVNVLRRTAGSLHGDVTEAVVGQAAGQYNRVLAALAKLDKGLDAVFVALPDDASEEVIVAACRQLAAYYSDEVSHAETPFESDSFKEFWRKSAEDLEEVGDFIRDSLGKMYREKKEREKPNKNGEA